ncbi:hypothetical protein [Flavobacterium sp. '19STA2R22 D10 B1']|uniref:HD domain-containing protein n=1 Tax=Flavobacterium aerium TaxID=3037261 RepID=UPI00278C363E|nr:hypothetical protein [Flavobacterium sp. '19STA2R22 D10 B1']
MHSVLLHQTFTSLANKYCQDHFLVTKLWQEIEEHYTAEDRHYHTLLHLLNILQLLLENKDNIKDWDTLLFTLFYHDVIYDASLTDNEEKSAELAEERLQYLNVPEPLIQKCKEQILATKTHQSHNDNDTLIFLDADLSILGQDLNTYGKYSQDIQKEYSIYPKLVYTAGRKKVIQHFLEMDRIYKTSFFYNRFEKQSRLNLMHELKNI